MKHVYPTCKRKKCTKNTSASVKNLRIAREGALNFCSLPEVRDILHLQLAISAPNELFFILIKISGHFPFQNKTIIARSKQSPNREQSKSFRKQNPISELI